MNTSSEKISRRFVAMVDILGFKEIVASHTMEELHRKFETYLGIVKATRNMTALFADPIDEIKNPPAVNYFQFSDTLFMWSEEVFGDGSVLDLGPTSTFLDACKDLIRFGILTEIPMRVGVAYGKVIIDKKTNIFLGQPIIDAHLLEQSQKWIGGALHPSCSRVPAIRNAEKDWADIIEYEIFDGNIRSPMLALNWTQGLKKSDLWFLNLPKEEVRADVAIKFEETVRFYNYASTKTLFARANDEMKSRSSSS